MFFSINKYNTCAIIITYFPDLNLLKSVTIIKPQVDLVIIVDNGTNDESISHINLLESHDGVIIIRNQENLGIATALNIGMRIARKKEYRWALTLDQDSIPYPNIMEVIKKSYYNFSANDKVAAIGVGYINKNVDYKLESFTNIPKIVSVLITSGTLINLELLFKVGSFREDFFIDRVDEEICLRFKVNGFYSIKTDTIAMMHSLGSKKCINLFGLSLCSSNHNKFRRYYMARNQVLLSKIYFSKFPIFIFKSTFFFLVDFFRIIFIDDNKVQKLKSTIKGVVHGIITDANSENTIHE